MIRLTADGGQVSNRIETSRGTLLVPAGSACCGMAAVASVIPLGLMLIFLSSAAAALSYWLVTNSEDVKSSIPFLIACLLVTLAVSSRLRWWHRSASLSTTPIARKRQEFLAQFGPKLYSQ